jgi:hypothetical protein
LTFVVCMILLILPFFFPEMNSRCSLASSTWKRISWWNAYLFRQYTPHFGELRK